MIVVGGDQHVLVLAALRAARREGRGSTPPRRPSVPGGAGSGSFRCACHLTGSPLHGGPTPLHTRGDRACTAARPAVCSIAFSRALSASMTSPRAARSASDSRSQSVSSSICAEPRRPVRLRLAQEPAQLLAPAPSAPRGRPPTRAAAGSAPPPAQGPRRPVRLRPRCSEPRSAPRTCAAARARSASASRRSRLSSSTCASRAARSASASLQEPRQLLHLGQSRLAVGARSARRASRMSLTAAAMSSSARNRRGQAPVAVGAARRARTGQRAEAPRPPTYRTGTGSARRARP